MTYSCGVHGVVEAAKLLDHKVYHGLDRRVVLNVHPEDGGLIVLVARILLAFFGRSFCRLFVHVCKHNGFGSGLSEGEGCFSADAAAGLYGGSSAILVSQYEMKRVITPTTRAIPSSWVPLIMVMVCLVVTIVVQPDLSGLSRKNNIFFGGRSGWCQVLEENNSSHMKSRYLDR
jgi:hypothetical protein